MSTEAGRGYPGYTADVLTEQALEWLQTGPTKKPFFLYLSHKSVHYPVSSPRRGGTWAGTPRRTRSTIPKRWPTRKATTRRNLDWLRDRRYSIHGIDHMEDGQLLTRIRCRIRRSVPPLLRDAVQLGREPRPRAEVPEGRFGLEPQNTLVLYLGDNGFALGEHGFYDKRDAFEVSIRVPLLAYAPGLIPPGTKVNPMVQNIDLAPTILDACGVPTPDAAQDRRPLRSCRCCRDSKCRGEIMSCTNTTGSGTSPPRPPRWPSARTGTSSFSTTASGDGTGCRLADRPLGERHNLIDVPEHRTLVADLRKRLYDWLEKTDGMQIPLRREVGGKCDKRGPKAASQLKFHEESK